MSENKCLDNIIGDPAIFLQEAFRPMLCEELKPSFPSGGCVPKLTFIPMDDYFMEDWGGWEI